MPVLQKAQLAIIEPGPNGREPKVVPNSARDVQFNPATLHLSLKNVQDRGDNRGRPVQQHVGADAERYTLELHFDSADEGRNGEPISVREHTQIIERYLHPREGAAPPPQLRFIWGDFVIDGLVESIELDFDHFAHTGVPLRAKAAVTLLRQDPTLAALPDASRRAGRATARASAGVGLGVGLSASVGASASASVGASFSASASASFSASASASASANTQLGVALGGETAAGFAARVGVDPAAWRGLGVDLEAGVGAGPGMSFEAGAAVEFSAGAGAAAGLGVHVGFDAGASMSVEARVGLSAGASAGAGLSAAAGATAQFSASADASLVPGFKLAAAGGVDAALQLSAGFDASVAVSGSVAAFGMSAGSAAAARVGGPTELVPSVSNYATAATMGGSRSASVRALPSGPSRPQQRHTPLAQLPQTSGRSLGQRVADHPAAPAPALPRVDPRAVSYGHGVPLRARVETRRRPQAQIDPLTPALASRLETPPWEALPARDHARQGADQTQTERRPSNCNTCSCDDRQRPPWSIEDELEPGA